MSPSNAELQRLLRLLSETATKAEEEAYAAGWRDCRAAIVSAVSAIGDAPHGSNDIYNPLPAMPHSEMPHSELNGASAERSYTN
jgi:hypothetical protein